MMATKDIVGPPGRKNVETLRYDEGNEIYRGEPTVRGPDQNRGKLEIWAIPG